MKTILVTGSSGTIGTRLCEQLLAAGYEVVGIDRQENRWSPEINGRTLLGDLGDRETLDRLPPGIAAVVHLAANARVYNLVQDPSLAYENITTVFNVLEFCRKRAIDNIVFASSREVYGNTDGVRRSEDEAQVRHCESAYTASKLAGEALVKAYDRCYGIGSIIVRFSNVYGMYDVSDRLIPLFLKRARQGRDLVVFGEGKLLDFTYIDDTVFGLLRCIERFQSVRGMTFNIASGTGTHITQLADLVRRRTHASCSGVVLRANRTGEVCQFVADISAARRHLDYTPRTSIDAGLTKTIQWYARCRDPIWLDDESPLLAKVS